MFSEFTRTIAAGGETTIAATGDGVACTASTLDTFLLAADGGPFGEFRRGFEWRPDAGFNDIQVKNPSTVALTFTLAIYGGNFADRRLILAPSSLEPDSVESLRAVGYFGTATVIAGAGVNPHLQLYNDVGSNKLVIVKNWSLSGSVAGQYVIAVSQTQAPTWVSDPVSLYAGDPSSSAALRSDTSIVGPVPSTNVQIGYLEANKNPALPSKRLTPILPPGWGFHATLFAFASTLDFNIEFLEIDA